MRYIRLELGAAVDAAAHRLDGLLWGVREKKAGWRLPERIRTRNDIVPLSLRSNKGERHIGQIGRITVPTSV